jgi:outer membrane biosynthesis protein TonB
MRHLRTLGIVCCAITLGALFFGLSTQADQWNKKTILTINDTIQIPGATLTPGKYVFRLMDSPANRHIVQVFNEDETQLINTILAIPNSRVRPTGDSEFGFWEMPQGSPPALRSWFYPGDNFGQEFAYPKSEATKIAAATNQPVQSIPDQSTAEDLKTATVTPEGEANVANNETPAATPAPQPEPQPEPSTQTAQTAPAAPVTEPTTPTTADQSARDTSTVDTTADRTSSTGTSTSPLPATASLFPLVGLVGFLSVGLGLLLRVIRLYH